MKVIKFRDWELIVDSELTYQTYRKASSGFSEDCKCNDCKNFRDNLEAVYPDEIVGLFHTLGIDYRKENEVYRSHRLEKGVHVYNGWFHFKGFFKGKDCARPISPGGFAFDLTSISENFSIGFRTDNALSFFEDKENLVQIEFEVKLPWVLDKELESDY